MIGIVVILVILWFLGVVTKNTLAGFCTSCLSSPSLSC